MSLLLLVAVLLLVPLAVRDSFFLNAAIHVFLLGTAALGWNLIGGYAGQLSFGHAVFFGVGAYTSSVLLSRHGVWPWVGGPVGAAVAVGLSLAIGAATFRLRRHFFALATLALAEIARITFLNWPYVEAAIGLYLPLHYRGRLAYLMWDGKIPYYLAGLALFAAALTLTWWVDRTRMGLYLKATNQDADAAEALGLPTLRYKLWAMGTSAALAALAGTLYAQYVLYIDPYTVMASRISLLVVVMALIGGRGTVFGPALGAAFIVLLSEYTRTALGHLGQGYDFILFGALIMLLAIYEPRGLLGLGRRARLRRPVPVVEGSAPTPLAAAGTPADRVALRVEGLSKRFGGVAALESVDLVVRQGEILGLIGPNGAGKSTLFDCITGFQRPDGGRVVVDGADLTARTPHALVHAGVVRTFQLVRVFPELTALENLLVAQPHRGESVWQALRPTPRAVGARAEGLLRRVGLAASRDVPAGELSYGQQKVLALAMALMTEAPVILLDEPTAGVHPALIQELVAQIRALNAEGRTFVVIEHNMEVVNALAHRVYFLAGGRVLAEGTPEAVRQDPQVLDAYYGH
ncbi:MAG: branched-chain amino acid ABC transporter ATP-binding protein/permease [Armatimonadota bacterium]|nr:branched-chain amino acid ABC transporter ATP-binding protein/permease [Armatimonadota bacterium]MDR7460220.1 branched-chain amino acid ABC transporter ATP-binding protein/permease [Armatimonadota bacterium]MDR7480307.1 branched-chain amino acid ABC transporter ATP-binding protein/permease [Armatimonadota bacterium]MDR7489129.1 branched-chain amino acid ABC transporter ATP-binding protein/permease [Armatimonadota bacterium]MDR7492051.1 branched-chain amino acid ABC transporter ATP-binding pr